MKKKYQKIEIFRPGRHTTLHGEAISFSEEDVTAIAQAYDPEKFEAPMVIGHPRLDAPAYGWVKGLKVAGGILNAEGHQVEPQFAELVDAGRFKKVSARFYRPDSPDNPVPGVWYLRHVGFLGAAAPAVKGLKPAAFSEEEKGTVDIEFGERDGWDLRQIATMFRRIREMFIEKFGGEEADKALPGWQVEDLEEAARRQLDKDAPQETAFSQSTEEDVDTMTPEQIRQKEQELQEREKKLTAAAAAARQSDAIAFAEDLVSVGKLLPAHKSRMAAFVASLSDETEVEFGEGEGKKSESQLTAFKAMAKDMPVSVEFGEVAGIWLGDPAKKGNGDVEFGEDLTSRV